MCYPCTNCGKCGRPRPKKGMCPHCGHQNEPDALKCEECGASFPLPPGVKVTKH